MAAHEYAYVRKLACGHVVAVVVEDVVPPFRHAQTLANWNRTAAAVERVTVEDARRLLGETFEAMQDGRHHRKRGCLAGGA